MGTGSGLKQRIKRNMTGLIASMAAVAALALTASMTLGGFTATVANSTSSFSSATVQLEEGNGTTTCYSTGSGSGGAVGSTNTNSSCAINVIGTATTDQVPGGTALTSTITLTDVGNHTPTVANLVVGSCTAGNASDNNSYEGTDTSGFCGKVDITINNNTSTHCIYPYSATQSCTALGGLSNSYTLATLAGDTFVQGAGTPSGSSQYGLSLPASGGGTAVYVITTQLDSSATNADQGLAATIPFTWSISQ